VIELGLLLAVVDSLGVALAVLAMVLALAIALRWLMR
jgi:hypothetical protein